MLEILWTKHLQVEEKVKLHIVESVEIEIFTFPNDKKIFDGYTKNFDTWMNNIWRQNLTFLDQVCLKNKCPVLRYEASSMVPKKEWHQNDTGSSQ